MESAIQKIDEEKTEQDNYEFLTLEALLGSWEEEDGQKVVAKHYWTNLCFHYEERKATVGDLIETYKRTNRSRNTLVFEMYRTFVQLIDPYKADEKKNFI